MSPGSASRPGLVLLAAGASARLGQCKALVDLGGVTVLEHLLAAGSGLDGAPPLVITGPDHRAIRAAAPAGVEVVANPDWSQGRTGGVQLAHRLRPGLALCLAPVDVPRVPRRVFELLARAWNQAGSPPSGWLAPRVEGPGSRPRFGHPVLLGPQLLAQGIAQGTALGPDEPLKQLRDQAEPLWSVPVAGLEVLEDLDTPEDLTRIRRNLNRD